MGKKTAPDQSHPRRRCRPKRWGGKMNEEQVDAMSPEERRRRRRGRFRKRWMDKMPFSPKIRPGGTWDVQDNSGKR